MLKYCLSIALACSAGVAVAQTQAPAAAPAPAPPMLSAEQSAVRTTAMALGQCVMTGVQGVAATVTPEAGATAVLGGCASQRQALDLAVDALIATLPEEGKAQAREQYRTQMAGAETQVADAIRRQRAALAPAPAQ